MNVTIEIILFIGGIMIAVAGYFFRTHDTRISTTADDVNDLKVRVTEIHLKVDEIHRIRSIYIETLHQLSSKIELLMEKIHSLSLQLQNKQDR